MTVAHDRKRRAPSTVLSQAAAGAMNIWPAENTEVSHEPSSKPRPSPPRMSARPKVVTRVFSVEMKAPISTAATPAKGRRQGAAVAVGLRIRAPAASRVTVMALDDSLVPDGHGFAGALSVTIVATADMPG